MGAANAHHTTVPGQGVAASIVAEIAAALLELDQRIRALNGRIAQTFHAHPQAGILKSCRVSARHRHHPRRRASSPPPETSADTPTPGTLPD